MDGWKKKKNYSIFNNKRRLSGKLFFAPSPLSLSFICMCAHAIERTNTHVWAKNEREVVINVKHLALVKPSSLFPIGEMMSMWSGLMLYPSLCYSCVWVFVHSNEKKNEFTSSFEDCEFVKTHCLDARFHSTIPHLTSIGRAIWITIARWFFTQHHLATGQRIQ